MSQNKTVVGRKAVIVTKNTIGRFCRVVFDDVGAVDGIITKVYARNDFRFLALNNPQQGDVHNNGAPCVAIGNSISFVNSGL